MYWLVLTITVCIDSNIRVQNESIYEYARCVQFAYESCDCESASFTYCFSFFVCVCVCVLCFLCCYHRFYFNKHKYICRGICVSLFMCSVTRCARNFYLCLANALLLLFLSLLLPFLCVCFFFLHQHVCSMFIRQKSFVLYTKYPYDLNVVNRIELIFILFLSLFIYVGIQTCRSLVCHTMKCERISDVEAEKK